MIVMICGCAAFSVGCCCVVPIHLITRWNARQTFEAYLI
jgi:hypothetical protein